MKKKTHTMNLADTLSADALSRVRGGSLWDEVVREIDLQLEIEDRGDVEAIEDLRSDNPLP